MVRAAGHDHGGAGGLGGGVDVGGVKNRVRGWFLAAFERVRGACRGGDLLGGLGHAGGLRVAVLVHLGPAESGQVAVDEHVVRVDDVQGAGAGAQQVRAPDERPPRGLGVIEADHKSEGPRRTGIWDAGDGRVAGPGGHRFSQDRWWRDGPGQHQGRASERRDQYQAGDAGQRPGGQGPQIWTGGMAAEVDHVADAAGRYP